MTESRGVFRLRTLRAENIQGDGVPLGDVWLTPAAADNAYIGGGGGGSTIMDKLTYATDGVARVPSANLNHNGGDNAAPFSSASAGYFSGGTQGTPSNPSLDRRSYVRKLTYSTETISLVDSVAQSPSGNGQGPKGQGGASSAESGYVGGGAGGAPGAATSYLQKLNYFSESWSILPQLPNAIEWQGDAIGNLNAGYWCGGSPSLRSWVQKASYSTDTTSRNPSSDLPVTGRYYAGASNAESGFLMGRGTSPTAHSTVIKFTFATDTASTHPSNLPVNVKQSRGTGSLIDGYAAGGAGGVSSIFKIQYSTGSTSTITDSMTRGGAADVLAVSARDHGATGFSPVVSYEDNVNAGDNVVEFDGNDAMCTNNDGSLTIGSNDFTVEAFVKYNQQDSNFRIFFDQRYGYGSTGNCIALFKASNNKIRAWHYPSNGTSIMESTSEVQANTWHHIAWTRTGGTNRLFFDGKLEDSTTTMGTTYLDGNTVELGGSYEQSNYYMLGQVSNERLTVGQALYTADFTVPTEPLTTTSQGALEGNVKFLGCNQDTVQGVTVGAGNGWRSNQGDPVATYSTTIPINQPPTPTPTSDQYFSFSSPARGYYTGGYAPGAPSGNYVSNSERLDFSSETFTVLPAMTVSPVAGSPYTLYRGASTTSNTAGYLLGGSGGGGSYYYSSIWKSTYSSETTAKIPSNLSGTRYQHVAAGTTNKGYALGGNRPGIQSNVDRITYSNDSVSNIGNMPSGNRQRGGAASSPTALYASQSYYRTNFEKITFASDTIAPIPSVNTPNPGASPSSYYGYAQISGTGNQTQGYFGGGVWATPGNGNTLLWKMTYSTDTLSSAPNLTGSRNYIRHTGDNDKGYFMGGSGPDTVSTATKFTFSTETFNTITGTMQYPKNAGQGYGPRDQGVHRLGTPNVV